MLRAADAPAVIDYLSLDVEGAEMDILRAFPWDQYTVLFATIETNADASKEQELRGFMRERGMDFLGAAGNDDYYAHPSVAPPRGAGPAGTGTFTFSPPLDYMDAKGHRTRADT